MSDTVVYPSLFADTILNKLCFEPMCAGGCFDIAQTRAMNFLIEAWCELLPMHISLIFPLACLPCKGSRHIYILTHISLPLSLFELAAFFSPGQRPSRICMPFGVSYRSEVDPRDRDRSGKNSSLLLARSLLIIASHDTALEVCRVQMAPKETLKKSLEAGLATIS